MTVDHQLIAPAGSADRRCVRCVPHAPTRSRCRRFRARCNMPPHRSTTPCVTGSSAPAAGDDGPRDDASWRRRRAPAMRRRVRHPGAAGLLRLGLSGRLREPPGTPTVPGWTSRRSKRRRRHNGGDSDGGPPPEPMRVCPLAECHHAGNPRLGTGVGLERRARAIARLRPAPSSADEVLDGRRSEPQAHLPRVRPARPELAQTLRQHRRGALRWQDIHPLLSSARRSTRRTARARSSCTHCTSTGPAHLGMGRDRAVPVLSRIRAPARRRAVEQVHSCLPSTPGSAVAPAISDRVSAWSMLRPNSDFGARQRASGA